MVAIPVKLYSATQTQSDISFNMLHASCGSRVKQQYICPTHNVPVPRDEIVKGYEFQKDRYVQFTAAEIKALEEKATQTIEITEFIPSAEIDPIYFDKPYYLGPDKGGDKPYALLARVMGKAGRVALAKYAARGKQYLVLLRPLGDALVLQQLRYADEVRTTEEVPVGDPTLVKDNELALAMQLVEQITHDKFKPELYRDEVKDRMAALIQKKVEGEDIVSAPEAAAQGEIIDLMDALKASLEKRGVGDTTRKPAKRVERAAAAPKPAAKSGKSRK